VVSGAFVDPRGSVSCEQGYSGSRFWGEVGQWVLSSLGRRREVPKVVAADVRADVGQYRVDSAMLCAGLEGFDTKFTFHALDLNNIDATARFIAALDPAVIFSSVTINSWWVLQPTFVPKPTYDALLKRDLVFCSLGTLVSCQN